MSSVTHAMLPPFCLLAPRLSHFYLPLHSSNTNQDAIAYKLEKPMDGVLTLWERIALRYVTL